MDEIDKRILRLIELLIFLKKIDNDTQFAEALNLGRQTVGNVKGGTQHFTAAHIYNICKTFDANPKYIFGLENIAFNYKESPVITDFDEKTMPATQNDKKK